MNNAANIADAIEFQQRAAVKYWESTVALDSGQPASLVASRQRAAEGNYSMARVLSGKVAA